jgi:cytochrome d ubiquinol oxidase subunit I
MEGWWQTRARQPSILFALPDAAAERNRFELAIPAAGSWVVAGYVDAELRGLDAFAPQDRPPVAWVFWGFRVMVGLGLAMIGMGLWGTWLWWRGGLEKSGLFQRAAVAMGPAGFLAVLAGWISAEVGRQPYVVYGVLRTHEAISPLVTGQVAASLVVFMTVYAIVFSVGTLYIMRLVNRGPGSGEKPLARGQEPARNPLGGLADGAGPAGGHP